jgi:hypothetical protein
MNYNVTGVTENNYQDVFVVKLTDGAAFLAEIIATKLYGVRELGSA